MMIKHKMLWFALLALFFSSLACVSGQSAPVPGEQDSLKQTISALQTQKVAAQQPVPSATPVPNDSQEGQLQDTLAALQTQVAIPVNQPSVQPTEIPTVTPIPSPTLLPDTLPNTLLEAGDTWRQEGLELTLTDVYLDKVPTGPGCWDCGAPGAFLTFYVVNHKAHQITLSYNLPEIMSVSDNLGRRVNIGATNDAYMSGFETKNVILDSGQKIHLISWGDYDPPSVIVLVDTTDPAVTEFVVTISLSSIHDARWRVPIFH